MAERVKYAAVGCGGMGRRHLNGMAALYKRSPKYSCLDPATRESYDGKLARIADHRLKDGRRFGEMALRSITGGVADKLFAKLVLKADGTERRRSAILTMAVARRAWNVARRASDRSYACCKRPLPPASSGGLPCHFTVAAT